MIRFDDILEKVSYSEKNITLVKKAYVFAAKAHQGQIRRSGEPYMSHPLEVANMLADMKLDHTTLAAGLLHDVLEDTGVDPLEIQQIFGKEISDLVEGVTKISRMESSSPETRQAESIRKIILAMTDDPRIIFIKLADRVHNLKTLKFLPEDKQSQVAQETLDVYAPIANRLGMGRIKAELEDLSFRYVDPDNYFKMASLLEPIRKPAEKEIKRMKKSLEELMKEKHIPADVFYRIKRPYSVFDKMQRQNITFGQVFDIMALRLITNSVRNCYSALGIIHQKWPHLPHRFRDFISMPKPNLYQALHTTLITEKKQTFEIQIRTSTMHNLAENGIAAHWKYKEPDPQTLAKEDARLRWLREMVELYKDQKSPREFLKNLKTDLIPEEVYVFTPKGKVITLPLGATALDFAFKIHTEIGFHAQGAKINGRSAPLKTMVKTGDRVEILTLPEKKPSRDWLNMVFTSTARHHIKRWLNQQDRIKNTALGKKLWEKDVKKYKFSPALLKQRPFLASLSRMTHFRIKTLDDFFFLVGSGKIIPDRKFMEKLFPDEEIAQRKDTLIKKVVKKVKKKPEAAIQVVDAEGSFVKLAKCCSPIKGEPITGYITSGKGITAHSLRCPLVRNEILDAQRMVDVSLEVSSVGTYQGRLLIKCKDTPGLLAALTSAIAALKGNITKAEVNTFADRKATVRLSLEIRDIRHLNRIMKKISDVRGVDQVERI
jgi:guanosine-3',5'-bis(diphosphate) 3'-pyrophosphohydrolase